MSKYTLPNGVEIEGKLYNQVEVDEIRGKHQNMLIKPNPKTPFDFIFPVLSDLVIDVQDSEFNSVMDRVSKRDLILHKLPIQDIQFLLIKIREVTYGKDYLFKMNCPHCEAKNEARLDISSLDIFPRKDKISEDAMILPKEQLEFRYKGMSLSDMMKMDLEDESSEFMNTLSTSVKAFRLARIGDKTNIKPSDLDELRASDLEFIEDNAPDLAEPDMKVEHKCAKCDKDFEEDISMRVIGADFLLRSRT